MTPTPGNLVSDSTRAAIAFDDILRFGSSAAAQELADKVAHIAKVAEVAAQPAESIARERRHVCIYEIKGFP